MAAYLGLPLLLIGAVAWADSVWHFLPRGSPGLSAECRIPNSDETVVIDCRIRPGPSLVGGGQFTLTVLAGVRRTSEGGQLIRDSKGTCHLQVLDSDGTVVLDQDLSLASLWVPA